MGVGSGQWGHSFPGECLGESDAVPAGLADVGVVQQPVDGGGCQSLGHQLVEGSWVQVGGDPDGALLVCGVYQAVEAFGGVGCDGQKPDVIDNQGPSEDRRWPCSWCRRRGGGGSGCPGLPG